MKTKIDKYYQTLAKKFVNHMFENKVFADHITRDHMKGYEDLMAFEYQCNADSIKRSLEFVAEIKKAELDKK